MTQIITRLFDTHEDASNAVAELERAGIRHDSISLVSNNADGRHGGDETDTADGFAKRPTIRRPDRQAAQGLLAGLGMLRDPGLGVASRGGRLAGYGRRRSAPWSTRPAGERHRRHVLGALKDAGHSDEDANVYAEGVRRGGSLVSVKSDQPGEIVAAQTVLASRGVEAAQRGALYRESGWSQFDEKAQPLSTAAEIAAERSRYAESRSFANREERDLAADDGVTSADGRPIDPTVRPL